MFARGQDDVALQQQWAVNGVHYSRTLEDWLARQDRQRGAILPIMKVGNSCFYLHLGSKEPG